MICYKCNHTLPDDSEFCQYCGERIGQQILMQETLIDEKSEEIVEVNKTTEFAENNLQNLGNEMQQELVIVVEEQEEVVENLLESKKTRTRFCKLCGGQIDALTKKCSGCGKQYFKGVKFNKFLVTVLVLSSVILASVIINVVQFVKTENLTEKVKSQSRTISTQTRTISTQKNKIDLLDQKSGYYDTICRELSYGNVGYAASNFKTSESVIVVNKNETNRKFTLTANWKSGGTVSTSYSGYSARVSFDKDSWTTSTKMTIEPNYEGVTVVKFSNNVDSKTFKIIIIVKS